ncbi:hypothetical protein NL676_007318 [Syzygium grande]|nr:hypothetical protein NL676_007318 [Syzygium grande]
MGKDDHKEDEDGGPLPAKTKLTTRTTEGVVWFGRAAVLAWMGVGGGRSEVKLGGDSSRRRMNREKDLI